MRRDALCQNHPQLTAVSSHVNGKQHWYLFHLNLQATHLKHGGLIKCFYNGNRSGWSFCLNIVTCLKNYRSNCSWVSMHPSEAAEEQVLTAGNQVHKYFNFSSQQSAIYSTRKKKRKKLCWITDMSQSLKESWYVYVPNNTSLVLFSLLFINRSDKHFFTLLQP